jgi:hypothetical protein
MTRLISLTPLAALLAAALPLASAAGQTPAPAPAPAPAEAPAAAPAEPAPPLENLTGDYEIAPGRTVTITLEDGRLYGQPAGSAKLPLVHLTGATFAVGQANGPTNVRFVLDPDGRAMAMVMRRNGNERTLNKVQ